MNAPDLDAAYRHALPLTEGAVADYIPELARADPRPLALGFCDLGGAQDAVGDADLRFTLQSISKAFAYAAALERFGRRRVLARVDVEPTGKPFNSYVRLEEDTHLPHNPMVNAGAIAIAEMLLGVVEPRELLSRFAGRELEIDEAVFRSEYETADRNRAIAALIAHFGGLRDPEGALELYLRSCSVTATCRDLAVMGATLASGGRNPLTGERVIGAACARDVLTVMMTCGMYDGSGRFALDVGLPGKSGVSGGVVCVVPGGGAFAAFSPRLDHSGNSVRGRAAMQALSAQTGASVFERGPTRCTRAELEAALDEVLERQRFVDGGAVADYAPELAAADPHAFAIAVQPANGERIARGDAAARFSLQAAGNPFAFALALGRNADEVYRRVDVEPSGNSFDAIDLRLGTHQAFNPLGNAGAIAVAELLADADDPGLFAGHPLPVDPDMLQSERFASRRNRAIAYLLRSFGHVGDVERALENYLRNCARTVGVGDLATMAAALAGAGDAVDQHCARQAVAVMFACGMHDDSGQFAYDVGIPAKSGISGAIVAVVPGFGGVAAYSPRVDRKGASVRAWAALRDLSGAVALGLFDGLR